ncbi:MAG TPA: response regulator [Acidimicrobiales bacterium]|nr:response regulator [Acidimicrobiales bacterium]
MPALFGDTAATLIVDDDPVVATVLESILSPEGYRCEVATDAAQARALLEQREFALALVDVMMPGQSGLELAADLVAKHRDLAVVMVTGVDEPAIAQLALDSGAYGYVVKPFRDTDVLVAVANAGQRRCREIEHRSHTDRMERMLADKTAELGDVLEGRDPQA